MTERRVVCEGSARGLREVWEGDGPEVLFGIGSTFGNEGESPLRCMIQVAFVESPVVIDCNLCIPLEDVW